MRVQRNWKGRCYCQAMRTARRRIEYTFDTFSFYSTEFTTIFYYFFYCCPGVLDFAHLTLHQAKRYEMESQVKVLELESSLDKERLRLAALRRQHYQLAGQGEEST